MRAKEVCFDTLNFCGGMDDKIDDTCKLMKDRQLDILCVNNTKRKGSVGPSNTAFCTHCLGVDRSQRGYQGVGFILPERFSEGKDTLTYLRRGKNKSMIDFIIVDDSLRRKVVDTRVYRSVNASATSATADGLAPEEASQTKKFCLQVIKKRPRKKFCLQVIKKRPRKPDVADVHEWCSAATDDNHTFLATQQILRVCLESVSASTISP
ncbi:hypothetical protein EVAR_25184_1 [Eumeta japonica]|uniref:Uncharacterized protein n=1 Tax=Eumeta variegata TaxID=151549 RepID=A0A4C1VU51_EUMVA|nr:hypothetical protein EVAR_25184_1 [Eumeta japonica]